MLVFIYAAQYNSTQIQLVNKTLKLLPIEDIGKSFSVILTRFSKLLYIPIVEIFESMSRVRLIKHRILAHET